MQSYNNLAYYNEAVTNHDPNGVALNLYARRLHEDNIRMGETSFIQRIFNIFTEYAYDSKVFLGIISIGGFITDIVLSRIYGYNRISFCLYFSINDNHSCIILLAEPTAFYYI